MDHRTRLIPIATTIDGPSALDLVNVRKSSFHSSFRRTITKVLSHSCQASNTGSALEKRKEIFEKLILVVVVRIRKKKCPVTERSFQKYLQDIVETKSPRA